MAVCDVCGKKRQVGMNVSHAHNRTKRIWKPNVQRIRTRVGGGTKRVYVCVSCIRGGKVVKA